MHKLRDIWERCYRLWQFRQYIIRGKYNAQLMSNLKCDLNLGYVEIKGDKYPNNWDIRMNGNPVSDVVDLNIHVDPSGVHLKVIVDTRRF